VVPVGGVVLGFADGSAGGMVASVVPVVPVAPVVPLVPDAPLASPAVPVAPVVPLVPISVVPVPVVPVPVAPVPVSPMVPVAPEVLLGTVAEVSAGTVVVAASSFLQAPSRVASTAAVSRIFGALVIAFIFKLLVYVYLVPQFPGGALRRQLVPPLAILGRNTQGTDAIRGPGAYFNPTEPIRHQALLAVG